MATSNEALGRVDIWELDFVILVFLSVLPCILYPGLPNVIAQVVKSDFKKMGLIQVVECKGATEPSKLYCGNLIVVLTFSYSVLMT